MSNPRGRQSIGVNQPPSGGSNYPFTQPSDDIKELLGDFFVSFDDIDEEIVYPLRVVWLYGFGDVSVSAPPEWPEPTHTHDLIVFDANDLVVFNSTQAETFSSSSWDDRLLILEWTNNDRVCRCTTYTEWTAADIASSQDKNYDNYIVPSNGELQAECWYRLPKRVTSLQVGLTTISATSVILSEGYNISLSQADSILDAFKRNQTGLSVTKQLVAGERKKNSILLKAIPGEGKGVFPGCVVEETVLRSINTVSSNAYQDFTYTTEDCIRSQRPVAVVSDLPRELSYAATGLSDIEAQSAIQSSNNCTTCCTCTYFAQTYQGLKRQWFLYRDVANLAEATRDRYASNRDRWLAEKAIRETDKLRLRISVDGDGKIRWGVAFCNTSKCCLNNLTLYLFFIPYVNGIFSNPVKSMFVCEPSYIEGSEQCNGPETIVANQILSNSFSYTWNYADPQSQVLLYGRVCLPDAKDLPADALTVKVWAAVMFQDVLNNPSTQLPCEMDNFDPGGWLLFEDVSEEVEATWLASFSNPDLIYAQKISPLTTVAKDNPFCSRCDCE